MTGREDVERVVGEALAGHRYRDVLGDSWVAAHEAHVAAVIAPLIEQARREAWDEGWDAAVAAPPWVMHPRATPCVADALVADGRKGDQCCCANCGESTPNPYRAERAAETPQETTNA